MDWNQMQYGVPEKFGEPCVIRTHKGNYFVATFELVGQMGGWITSDARIVDIFHVTHWAYITPPNNR